MAGDLASLQDAGSRAAFQGCSVASLARTLATICHAFGIKSPDVVFLALDARGIKEISQGLSVAIPLVVM
jgi:hypothetical protein